MKIENIKPNIIQFQFHQEKTDNDYGSCLWGNVAIDCDNYTLFIERNACSKLYGACVRIAREMGYSKVITYILASEDGASLRASNFVCEGKAGKPMWTGSRKRDNGVPQEFKQRYVFYCQKGR